MQTTQNKWVKEFGRIYRTWLGFRTAVHVSTPSFMEVIVNCEATKAKLIESWFCGQQA